MSTNNEGSALLNYRQKEPSFRPQSSSSKFTYPSMLCAHGGHTLSATKTRLPSFLKKIFILRKRSSMLSVHAIATPAGKNSVRRRCDRFHHFVLLFLGPVLQQNPRIFIERNTPEQALIHYRIDCCCTEEHCRQQ